MVKTFSPKYTTQYNAKSKTFGFFFFNDTATTEIYTLSLHDALPIFRQPTREAPLQLGGELGVRPAVGVVLRSEEHTTELQSQSNLVCRLLLEKKIAGEPDFVLLYSFEVSSLQEHQ